MINDLSNNVKSLIKTKKNLKEKLNNVWNEYKFMLKPFMWISLIFAIGLIAIIRADFNYCDDLRRVALGFNGWDGFSRFNSSFLAYFIHGDNYLTDISPLPQLLAACIMALACVIILSVYKKDKKISLLDIIAVIPIGLSPYFLECFSYKYDAPYMAISVLASVFPLLFMHKRKVIYSIVIIISMLIMCTTYQASSGIFVMLILLLCLKKWNEGESIKENFKFMILSFSNYLIALIIFKVFIMIPEDS